MSRTHAVKIASGVALSGLVLLIYSYPSWKLHENLGPNNLPPIVAPDLTLYLNLGNLTPVGNGEVVNPYYRIPVPVDAAGYLKFGLAPRSFGEINRFFHRPAWAILFWWNAFWWACVCAAAIWLFVRFLPLPSAWFVALGTALLMFFNFGVAKTVILAWIHLPSLAGFSGLDLPYMRAFIPVIPCFLVLAYLGCQMEISKSGTSPLWIAMATLQLLALEVFPYATLIMAGITGTTVVSQAIRIGATKIWRATLLYAIFCAFLDGAFLLRGSFGFYANRSPAIHLQPNLLPRLVGGNWILVAVVSVAVAAMNTVSPEIKWPLVGLGASTALLMLGDSVVPASKLLLSHHAGHFVHMTIAILLTFLLTGIIASRQAEESRLIRWLVVSALLLVISNGALIASGTYRAFLDANRDSEALTNLQRVWTPAVGDLVIARSKDVDDACGWVALSSPAPVLFCTDAEVMLSPEQTRDIHRFRQALYLYLTGESSGSLQRKLSSPDRSSTMYRLGYWAEAVSPSPEERNQGVAQIETDLLPQLRKVEQHDPSASRFFRNFQRIVVVDKKQQGGAFASEQLTSFLEFEGRQDYGNFEVSFYRPR